MPEYENEMRSVMKALRKPEWKREKDLDAVRYVLIYVKASRKYRDELKSSVTSAPRKSRRVIIDAAAKAGIDLGL